MTNKEKQQITTDVASAVINDIRNNLADYTWEEIAEIAAQGKAAANFRIGDKKELELITGEKLTAVIIGFDHDVIYNDKSDAAAGITFAIEKISVQRLIFLC